MQVGHIGSPHWGHPVRSGLTTEINCINIVIFTFSSSSCFEYRLVKLAIVCVVTGVPENILQFGMEGHNFYLAIMQLQWL